MRGEIFLLQEDNSLLEMKEEEYVSEDLFQSLLEDYPKLISGAQINPDSPRRWILIKREMGIPDKDNGAGRWSIDHLFLDQEAVPTLVEVKRSTDTRTRREVVAQMLDYAANSIQFWKIDEITESYRNTCSEKGLDPDSYLENILKTGMSLDEYWGLLEANLKQGKIRMLFVADRIPPELQRIVEFLNEQMNPAEVLAMEIKQYTGQNLKTMVSRVVGKTMKAADIKAVRGGKPREWDRESLLAHICERESEDAALAAESLIDWCENKGYTVKYGSGSTIGTANLGFTSDEGKFYKFFELEPKYIRIVFNFLKNYPPFNAPEKRIELIRRFNETDGATFKEDYPDTNSNSQLSLLSGEKNLKQFCEIYEWMVNQIEKNFSIQ